MHFRLKCITPTILMGLGAACGNDTSTLEAGQQHTDSGTP